MSITGPFGEYHDDFGFYQSRIWYRQNNKPKQPLPYDNLTCSSSRTGNLSYPPGTLCFPLLTSPPGQAEAYAKAFDRFASKARNGKSASIGVSLSEASQSFRMIASRSRQFLDIATSIKSGNLPKLYKSLRLPRKDKRPIRAVERAKQDVSGAILEVNFGWVPLLRDIFNAVDVLQSDFPSGSERGRGSYLYEFRDELTSSGVKNTIITSSNVVCEVGGRVRVINPNLLLANQLGLINPAQVAWELIPFSFLVDWFIPVGGFLGGFTAFQGLSISDTYVTYLSNASSFHDRHYLAYPNYLDQETGKGYRFIRQVGELPLPTLMSRSKLPGGNLLGKAVNSVALLVQQLSKGK
jgi:hypothetical protein